MKKQKKQDEKLRKEIEPLNAEQRIELAITSLIDLTNALTTLLVEKKIITKKEISKTIDSFGEKVKEFEKEGLITEIKKPIKPKYIG